MQNIATQMQDPSLDLHWTIKKSQNLLSVKLLFKTIS